MTTKLRELKFFGEGVYSKSAVVTRQRRLNCYYETRPDGDKSTIVIYGTPGMLLKFNVATPAGTPLRGILGTESTLYAAASNVFMSLNSDGTIANSYNLTTSSGNVSFSFNPTQVIIVDGAAGWIYTPSGPTWAQITDANFPNGAKTVTFLQSFFVVEEPNSYNFYVSSSGDGTTWNALGFGGAAQYPDTLIAVDNLSGMLVLFCQQHIEFWQNVGTSPQPFQYIANSASEYGLAAVFSRVHIANSILFLTQTREGGLQVAAMTGYNIQIVSTTDIDNIIQSFSTTSDAVGLTYQSDQHKFYQLTFPTENRSFLYDVTTGSWYEAQTGLTSLYAQRHIGQFSTTYAGKTLITDYSNGNIYTPDSNTYTDNGTTIQRECVTRHAKSNFNRFRTSSVYLDMDTGHGLNGSSAQIMMQVSKDNGRTWGNERWAQLGILGNYIARVVWRRVTYARDVVLKFRMTDPVKFVITSGAVIMRQRGAK
jgi:hypothetical protein